MIGRRFGLGRAVALSALLHVMALAAMARFGGDALPDPVRMSIGFLPTAGRTEEPPDGSSRGLPIGEALDSEHQPPRDTGAEDEKRAAALTEAPSAPPALHEKPAGDFAALDAVTVAAALYATQPETEGADRGESGGGEANGSGAVGGESSGDPADSIDSGAPAVFLRRLDEEIRRNLSYPAAARRRGLEGTVEIRISVSAGGHLLAGEVKASSGHAILDQAALRLLRSLFPLDISLARGFELTVRIEYRLSA